MMIGIWMISIVVFNRINGVESDDSNVESVEIGPNGEAAHYDANDLSDFDLDYIERRLSVAGIDVDGEEYVFVDIFNSRSYPPFNAEDNFDHRVNTDNLRRLATGESGDPSKDDKWSVIAHDDAVIGCVEPSKCGLFVKRSVISDELGLDMDLSNLENRRLSVFDPSLITKDCNDESCDYVLSLPHELHSDEDDIPTETRFSDWEINAQCNGQTCFGLVDSENFRRKLGFFTKDCCNSGGNKRGKAKRGSACPLWLQHKCEPNKKSRFTGFRKSRKT